METFIRKSLESHGMLRGMVAVGGFNGVFCFSTYVLSPKHRSRVRHCGLLRFHRPRLRDYEAGGRPFPLGNRTVVILVILLGGMQLSSVGILGEYIGRIYEEVRARLELLVERAEGLQMCIASLHS